MLKLLKHIGLYFLMMKKLLAFLKNQKAFKKQLILELEKIGLQSIGIVLFISFLLEV